MADFDVELFTPSFLEVERFGGQISVEILVNSSSSTDAIDQFDHRVYDSVATDFVHWSTLAEPDTSGTNYPGPGTFGVHTSDFTVVVRRIEPSVSGTNISYRHASTDETVGLWQLDGNLNAATGSNLSTATGTASYLELGPDWKSVLYCNGSYRAAVSAASLRIADEVTIMCLLCPFTTAGSDQYVMIQAGTSESSADNILYSLLLQSSNQVSFRSETGSGTDATAASGFNLSVFQWYHVAITRSGAGSVKIYVDGDLKSTTSLGGADGGGSGTFSLGGGPGDSDFFTGLVCSPTVLNRALEATEVVEAARRTLPYNKRP